MNGDNVLKKILMLPAYVHAGALAAREHLAHVRRKRLGESSRRSECCAPLPETFPLRESVADIPELAEKLELVSTINTGYTRWFGCRVCGQEWREDHEAVGNYGEYPRVRKAT